MSYLDTSQCAAAWGGVMEEIRGGTSLQGVEYFRQTGSQQGILVTSLASLHLPAELSIDSGKDNGPGEQLSSVTSCRMGLFWGHPVWPPGPQVRTRHLQLAYHYKMPGT